MASIQLIICGFTRYHDNSVVPRHFYMQLFSYVRCMIIFGQVKYLFKMLIEVKSH